MEVILKSLSAEGEWVVNTYRKVFKFDISCENIQRMASHMIDIQRYA